MKQAMLAVLFCGVLFGNVLAQEKPCKPRRHAKLPVVKDSTYHKARKKLTRCRMAAISDQILRRF